MSSRGFPKSNRSSNAYNQNNMLSNVNNDNYYPESSSRNYNTSREFHQGIFTSQLNKRDVKKKETELALEIQEVPDYSASKRVSSKRNMIVRESRDEYIRQSQANSTQNVQMIVRQQVEAVKSEIYQNVSQVIKEQGSKYDKALLQLVTQINTALKKKQQNYYNLKLDNSHLRQSLANLNHQFQTFSKQNQEKLETLVNQMATTNNKKPKAHGDYGVDLKNSFQGISSSFSVNLGNQNSNSKLVNEVIYQLDSLKKELNDTKMQIEQMDLKICSKIKSENSSQSKGQSLLKEEVVMMIEKKIKEQKKSCRLQQKYQSFESKLHNLHEILQKQEENIFGINQQLKNTINNQMNPKIKKIQGSIIDIYSKIDPLSFQNLIREMIAKEMNDKLKDCRLLKIRNCTQMQSSKISSITGMNEDKITYKDTYLIDEQNYLLDSQGNYLVQQTNGVKSRVKVQPNLIYLLGLRGIQIANCS